MVLEIFLPIHNAQFHHNPPVRGSVAKLCNPRAHQSMSAEIKEIQFFSNNSKHAIKLSTYFSNCIYYRIQLFFNCMPVKYILIQNLDRFKRYTHYFLHPIRLALEAHEN